MCIRDSDQTHFDHRPVALGADSMLANQFDPPVDEALGRSQPLDVRGHRFGELRGYFLDPRNDAEPELVAQVFGRSVRRVLPIGNLVGPVSYTHLLSRKFRTAVTQGNLNNHIGVPLTLLAMDRSVEIGVVEMGASHPGEIALLCSIARPAYGLIPNIGTVSYPHLK